MKASMRLATAACLVLLVPGVSTAELDDTERAIIEWVDTNAEASIDLLEETVNISSGTMNHEGVREVGSVMRRELDEIGMDTDWIELPPAANRAGHLVGKLDGNRGKRMLLIGHLDTVFEADDSFPCTP